MASYEIHGHCDERFAGVAAAFEKNLATGAELGGAFALAIEGEYLVDLWGGHADGGRNRSWERDTLVPVFSSSKIIVALCGLILLDRELIDLDTPVATYWPEFAANGKESVLVRHLFCHASGLAGFEPPVTAELVLDWGRAIAQLAAQAPWWEPGTATGYHAMTFGFLLGELLQRVTGRSFLDFYLQEIATPIGADFHFGVPRAEWPRVADMVSNGTLRPSHEAGSVAARAEPDLGEPMLDVVNSARWRTGINPGANGLGNARSMVRIGSILANRGTLHGRTYLSADTVALAHQEQMYVEDLVLGAPVRYGLGFGLASREIPIPFPNAFHWGGAGGSSMVMEPDRGACFSYVTNYMDGAVMGDVRGARLNRAAIQCLLEL